MRSLKRKFPLVSLPALAFIFCSPLSGTAQLVAFQDLVANPSDEGSGPAIWYKSDREMNYGSASDGLTLTSQGAMTDSRLDYFGNPDGAFGLAPGETLGAGIAGSSDTPYLSDNAASVILKFQTPSTINANASIIGRMPSGSVVGQPKFEVLLLSNKDLRITTGDTRFGVNNVVSNLTEDTWYYMAMTWDLTLDTNQFSWSLGEMGGSITGGSFDDVSVIGDPNSPIRVGGRVTSAPFHGAYQDIAIYDRMLSAQAIQDQFGALSAVPEPSTYAVIVGLLAIGGMMVRRYRAPRAHLRLQSKPAHPAPPSAGFMRVSNSLEWRGEILPVCFLYITLRVSSRAAWQFVIIRWRSFRSMR